MGSPTEKFWKIFAKINFIKNFIKIFLMFFFLLLLCFPSVEHNLYFKDYLMFQSLEI